MRGLDVLSVVSALALGACATAQDDYAGSTDTQTFDSGQHVPANGGAAGQGGDAPSAGGATASAGGVSSGSGGAPANGGATATGMGGAGATSNGGSFGTAGVAGAPNGGGFGTGGRATGGGANGCATGQKLCGGACSTAVPNNGCNAAGCAACATPAPANGLLACNAQGACDFECLSGFEKSGTTCAVSGTTTGDGGVVSCHNRQCRACDNGEVACCGGLLKNCLCVATDEVSRRCN